MSLRKRSFLDRASAVMVVATVGRWVPSSVLFVSHRIPFGVNDDGEEGGGWQNN